MTLEIASIVFGALGFLVAVYFLLRKLSKSRAK